MRTYVQRSNGKMVKCGNRFGRFEKSRDRGADRGSRNQVAERDRRKLEQQEIADIVELNVSTDAGSEDESARDCYFQNRRVEVELVYDERGHVAYAAAGACSDFCS